MRKSNRPMQAYLSPKIQSAVIATKFMSDSLDSLWKYEMQFLGHNESPLANFRVSKRHKRTSTLPYEDNKLASGIKEVSKEFSDLKK
jgi:hypothetical protein